MTASVPTEALLEELNVPCLPWGCMIYFTLRCEHRCEHCYVDFNRGGVLDMQDSALSVIIEKGASSGLLRNITLVGGEPFIDC